MTGLQPHLTMDEMIEQVTPVHVTLDDLEDLIGALSIEELEELAECDPDDSSMPPSMRCAYKCKKEATEWKGEENRNKLQEGLKAQALADPDKVEKVKWEQGTKRGKVYVPKEPEAPVKSGYDSDDEEEAKKKEVVEDPGVLDDEYTQALQIATATDIQDIADILGVTFQEHCSATALKVFPQEAPNSTNIDEVIQKASTNDGELTDINLNNIKYISDEKWAKLFEALGGNENVESLSAANCNLTDPLCKLLCNCLESNKSIRSLNLESNSVSPDMVMDIIKSTIGTKTLEELRVASQFSGAYLGSAIEYAIIDLLPKVPHLVKLGVRMEFRDSLNKCALALAKNLDKRRQTEDRTFSLQMDAKGKTGPKIVSDKR